MLLGDKSNTVYFASDETFQALPVLIETGGF